VIKIINPINSNILDMVVKLHIESLSQGLLSQLGENTLKCFYKSITEHNKSILIVYLDNDNNELIGFISGTCNLQEFKKYFLKNCFTVLIKSLIKNFNFSMIKGIYNKIIYTTNLKEKYDIPIKSELISIVVSDKYRKKGLGKELFKELELFFRNREIREFKILVGKDLINSQKFYEKLGAKKLFNYWNSKNYIYVYKIK